jgi:hypothetical protein
VLSVALSVSIFACDRALAVGIGLNKARIHAEVLAANQAAAEYARDASGPIADSVNNRFNRLNKAKTSRLDLVATWWLATRASSAPHANALVVRSF